MYWLLRGVASGLALLVIANLHRVGLPLHIYLKDATALIIAVLVMGVVNSFIRPIIMFFAWPLNCLTFGLLGFAINVFLFWVVGHLNFGFLVERPIDAAVGSILMGLLSGFFNMILTDKSSRD